MRQSRFSLRSLLLLTLLTAIGIVAFQSATDSTLDRRLQNAMRSDQTLAVRFYLWLGADPNDGVGVVSHGGSPLHQAALDGNIRYVKQLLDAGAIVNCFEKDGFTPIVYAADEGHWEIVKMLFDAGADHRATGADGARVVDYAMEAGRDEIVRLLTNECFPSDFWSVEVSVTSLNEDRDGLPYYDTGKGDRHKRVASNAPCPKLGLSPSGLSHLVPPVPIWFPPARGRVAQRPRRLPKSHAFFGSLPFARVSWGAHSAKSWSSFD